MDLLHQTDLMLRGGGIAVLALCAIAVMHPAPRSRLAWALAAMAAGLVAYLLISAPIHDGAPNPVLFLLAATCPGFVWWAAVELFEDHSPLRRWVLPMIAMVLALSIAGRVWPVAGWARGALMLVIYGHILLIAWRGDATDLIARRRFLRRVVLALGAGLGLVISVVELGFDESQLPALIFPLQAAALLGIAAGFALWLFRVEDGVFPTEAAIRPDPVPLLSDAERAVLVRLEAAMAQGAWQREGLSIGQLAEDLDTAEHRLRRIINRGLEHRNFAGFINGYRVRAAAKILADPMQAERSVLEIAHDVGFASLGPFNRAFRAHTGQSPSEFRAAFSEKSQPISKQPR